MFGQDGRTKLLSNYVAKQTAFRKTKTRLSRGNVYGNPGQTSYTRNRISLSNASLAFEFVFQLTNRRKWFFKKFFVPYLHSLGEKQKRKRGDCARDRRGKNPLHETYNKMSSMFTRRSSYYTQASPIYLCLILNVDFFFYF